MKNNSGIRPMKYYVLVKPKQVERITAGGIYLPDDVKEKDQYAQEIGTLIAVGSLAFTDPPWLEYPAVGVDIMFTKYAGKKVKGKDGEDYRLISDDEINAAMV